MASQDGKIRKEDLVQSGALGVYDELKNKAIPTLKAIIKEMDTLAKAQGKVGVSLSNSSKLYETSTNKLKAAVKTINSATTATNRLSKSQKANTKAINTQSKANKGLIGTFQTLLKSMLAFVGVRMFLQIIKDTYSLVKSLDSLEFSMKKITKNAFDLGVSFRFVTEISRDFGTSFKVTAERWLKFLAAAKQSGVTLRDTEKIFKSMTKAASVLGLKTDELKGVYLALEQMLSKGKVTTEELRRQLGERLPGAMGIMAASMGVTISQLDKMMKNGEVLSSEVLPRFADAVELAYGIKSVESVNTLTAAQNKLTTAWQLFVKYVLSDSTLIGQAFSTIAKGIQNITEYFSFSAKMDSGIIAKKKAIGDAIFKNSKKALDKTLKEGKKYNDIELKILDIKNKLILAKLEDNNDEEIKLLNEKLNKQVKILLEYNDKIETISQKTAFAGIKDVKKRLKEITPEFNKIKEESDKVGVSWKDLVIPLAGVNREVRRLISKNKLNSKENVKTIQEYQTLTALLENYKKLVEKGVKVTPSGDGSGGSKKNLRLIYDLQNKLRIEDLKKQIEANKDKLKDEKTTFEERFALISENYDLEREIEDLRLKDAKAKIEAKFNKDMEGIKAGSERAIALKTERDQNIELLEKQHQANIEKIRHNGLSDFEWSKNEEVKRVKETLAINKKNIEADLQIKLNAIDKEYNASKKSDKDKEKRKLAIDKAIFESNKLVTLAIIKSVKDTIKIMKEAGLSVDELEATLRKLEAQANKPYVPDEKDLLTPLEKWKEALQAISEAMGGLSDISANYHERNIIALEREMEATEERYARLKELAGDDADQKEQLDRELEAKRKINEAKIRKEKEKQWKIDQKVALAQAAINIALGITKVIANPFMVALVSALGAIQLTAIATQPMPKFAEGGVMEYDGKALINDGGKREFVERNGMIFSTPIKDAVVDLQKGDIIHKDIDALMNASIITSLINDTKTLDASKLNVIFDKNYANLETAIKRGFKGARQNINITQNKVDIPHALYRNSQIEWQ